MEQMKEYAWRSSRSFPFWRKFSFAGPLKGCLQMGVGVGVRCGSGEKACDRRFLSFLEARGTLHLRTS